VLGLLVRVRRIVAIICAEDPAVAATWARWSRWLVVAAVAAALLPTLNCLQRGQVGILKLYLLMLGLRLILGGRSYRSWLGGGIVLALPVALKILPLLQVGFLLCLLLIDLLRAYWKRSPMRASIGRRFVASGTGFAAGLVLFFLLVPAMLIGWQANLHTWIPGHDSC